MSSKGRSYSSDRRHLFLDLCPNGVKAESVCLALRCVIPETLIKPLLILNSTYGICIQRLLSPETQNDIARLPGLTALPSGPGITHSESD